MSSAASRWRAGGAGWGKTTAAFPTSSVRPFPPLRRDREAGRGGGDTTGRMGDSPCKICGNGLVCLRLLDGDDQGKNGPCQGENGVRKFSTVDFFLILFTFFLSSGFIFLKYRSRKKCKSEMGSLSLGSTIPNKCFPMTNFRNEPNLCKFPITIIFSFKFLNFAG